MNRLKQSALSDPYLHRASVDSIRLRYEATLLPSTIPEMEVRRKEQSHLLWHDMVHDYAHFLTSRFKSVVFVEGQGRFRSESGSEQFAEYFTPNYLMPTVGLRRRVSDIREASQKKFPISDVLRVAHRYGVSPQALVRHLEELRELPSGTWNQMRERISIKEAQERLGLGNVAGRDKIVPIRYHQLALSALDDDLISEAQFAQFLRVNRLQARQESYFEPQDEDSQVLQQQLKTGIGR